MFPILFLMLFPVLTLYPDLTIMGQIYLLEIQHWRPVVEKYLSLLARSPLFSGIAQGDIASMLSCLGARLGEYSKTETIFMEGESARLLGIVLSGAVQVVRDDYWGSRSVLAILEPGELFGEVFSCAALESLPVSVLALRDCRVLLLDCRRVLSTCPSSCSFHSLLIRNLLQGLALKNLELTRKIHCMSRKTTREKLLAYLMDQAKKQGSSEFVIPCGRQTLADYLGVERSAMSAELGRLKRDGLLDTKGSWFSLHLPEEKV